MVNCKRFRKRWTIKECLNLQREFELLKLSIDEIALKHQRTPNAIMLKLDEQSLGDYNVLYRNYHGLNSPMEVIRKHTYDEFDDNIVNNFIDEKIDDLAGDDLAGDDLAGDEFESSDLDQDEMSTLSKRIEQLENHVSTLTELVLKLSNKNKSVFSLFT
jgi:TATA-binding protein-associated factor Taf7